jgi:DNA-directed RNA polymerase subunit M/transcription elongation factor TFIIS
LTNLELKHALSVLRAELIALRNRVSELEIKAAPQEKTVAKVENLVPDMPPAVAAPNRKMCPKCGEKPAYFFHVRTCAGQKEEKQDAENTLRRRDPSKA